MTEQSSTQDDVAEFEEPEGTDWRVSHQEDGTTSLYLLRPQYQDARGGLLEPQGGTYDTPNLARMAINKGLAWQHAAAFLAEHLPESTSIEPGKDA